MSKTIEHELRCACRNNPLLATYGLDKKGKLYIHVKVFKQNRLFTECVFQGGVVRIKCRNCLHWHTIHIVGETASLRDVSPADTYVNDVLAG